MSRFRFAKDATVAGWRQLVELSNHLGAALLVLLLVSLSVGSGYKLPHWWIGLIVFAVGYFLLFAEGWFQVQRVLRARYDELERLKHDVRYGRTMRVRWLNTGP